MKRRVSAQPFEFQSDFSAPKPENKEDPGRVTMPAEDFASYLSQARAEGLMEGRASAASEEAERMDAVSQQLREALGDLVLLAEHLEASSGNDGTPDAVRALIKSAAQRLVDGQGDLFTQK